MDTSTPIQFVKGVEPKRAQNFPRDWVFMPKPIKIERSRPNQTGTIVSLFEAAIEINLNDTNAKD